MGSAKQTRHAHAMPPDIPPMLAESGVPRSMDGWAAKPKLDGWRARVLV
jgi:ATP-dependent DNA ligase